jgi:hypothetical protein
MSDFEQDIFGEESETPKAVELDANGEPKRALPEAAKKFWFKPGQSGNPGGRNKTKPFKKAIQKYLRAEPGKAPKPENEMDRIAMNLVAMAASQEKKGKANVIRAIKEIADRIDGKAMPSPEELESNKGSKVILINSNPTESEPPAGE